MISVICAVMALATTGEDTYNYTGRLVDLLNEGLTWGMPTTGQPFTITITDNGSKVGPNTFNLKAASWKSEGVLQLNGLAYSGGSLSGNATFRNTSGKALDAVRFDIVSAIEHYKGQDKDGKDVILSRSLQVEEDSPILMGDMPKDTSFDGAAFKVSGLAWKPETTDIVVTGKLSGLTFMRDVFNDHYRSSLDTDPKGRLIIGSGMKAGIYRADPDKDSIELVASTPSEGVRIASNPVDGTLAASWLNSHTFNLYSPGGDDKATIEEGETEGMQSWPGIPHFDGKGNLYLNFGNTVAQMAGNKPSFVLAKQGQFDFGGDINFDIARDGTLYVATEGNIHQFQPGGKGGKRLLQGPSLKLGRIHGIAYLRVDPSGNIWVADATDGDFYDRIDVFDPSGKLIWVFGRGGPTHLDEHSYEGQVRGGTYGIAFAPDGRVYVSCDDFERGIREFAPF